MEKKVIKYLQEDVVNPWKDAFKNDDDYMKEFYRTKWLNCKYMAESILGKEVTIMKWTVVVK